MRSRADSDNPVNGPFDGSEVEDDRGDAILWVYKNVYDQSRAIRRVVCRARPTMAAYVVMPGRHEAVHGIE